MKIGDKVKRINGEHQGMKRGDVGTIIGFNEIGVRLKEYGGMDCTHDLINLKLITNDMTKTMVVNCPTKDSYIKLMKKYPWYDGETHEDYWDDYEKDFCVEIIDGEITSYCNRGYFEKEEEKIIPVAKFLKGYKEPKVNFLLKYELDEDPVEEFETMKEVEKRIKELLDNEDLKKDSLVVYEIKSVKKVKLETKVKFE